MAFKVFTGTATINGEPNKKVTFKIANFRGNDEQAKKLIIQSNPKQKYENLVIQEVADGDKKFETIDDLAARPEFSQSVASPANETVAQSSTSNVNPADAAHSPAESK